MKIATRNGFIQGVLAVVFLLSWGIFFTLFLFSPETEDLPVLKMTQTWWFLYEARGGAASVPMLVIVGVFILTIATGLIARLWFRRAPSADLFFFVLFILFLAFQTPRALVPLILAKNLPPSLLVFITRIAYIAYFCGVLSLFVCSFYVLRTSYPNLTLLFFLVCILSCAVGLRIPLDQSTLLQTLLYKLGEERGVGLFSLSLQSLTLLNVLRAFLAKPSRGSLVLLIAIVMIMPGREILFFFPANPILALLGLLLFGAGSLLFLRALFSLSRGDIEESFI